MALRIIREVNRSLGFAKTSGTTIISGQPLMLDSTAAALKPFDGSVTNAKPYGLALEDSQVPPLQASSANQTVGQGYDYTNFARGGLYSVLCDGGEFELYNDGRGAPFVTSDTYQIMGPVYANASGLLTSQSSGNALVGYCTAVTGSPVTTLRVKLSGI
jgi:hypothetical protein